MRHQLCAMLGDSAILRELRTERLSLRQWRDEGADALHDLPGEPRLYSFTTPENRRSRAVMERLGFAERGRVFYRGYDMVWYALDRA